MELHSYAKRRASKKWTIEQKRKLVEARINYDSWFNSKPSNSVVPWKKVLSVAKLDDFNVFFVRKQWSNMLTRYKQYKQTRLDGIATNKAIHSEMIERINQEWEFFEAIHAFMTRKTTNLHSYAVTQKFANTSISSDGAAAGVDGSNEAIAIANTVAVGHVAQQAGDDGGGVNDVTAAQARSHEQRDHMKSSVSPSLMKLQHDCAKENIPNNATILLQVAGSSVPRIVEGMQLFSSDTNEEFEVIGAAGAGEDIIKSCARNTDHDFYSKRSAGAGAVGSTVVIRKFPIEERQLHYFLDTSEESMGTEYVQHTSSMESSSLPSVMENIELHTENARTFEIKAENITQYHNDSAVAATITSTIIKQENFSMTEMPSTSTEGRNKSTTTTAATTTQTQNPTSTSAALPSAVSASTRLSERDRYYRHKRRFNRRLEKRFDALLNVVGQVVKAEYPRVDVQPLLETVTSMTSGLGQMLTSESEGDDDTDDATELRPK